MGKAENNEKEAWPAHSLETESQAISVPTKFLNEHVKKAQDTEKSPQISGQVTHQRGSKHGKEKKRLKSAALESMASSALGKSRALLGDLPDSCRIPSPPPESPKPSPIIKNGRDKSANFNRPDTVLARVSRQNPHKSEQSTNTPMTPYNINNSTKSASSNIPSQTSYSYSSKSAPRKYYSPFETGLHVELPVFSQPHSGGCNFSTGCHAAHYITKTNPVKIPSDRPPAFSSNLSGERGRCHNSSNRKRRQEEFSLFDKRLSSVFGRSPN